MYNSLHYLHDVNNEQTIVFLLKTEIFVTDKKHYLHKYITHVIYIVYTMSTIKFLKINH